MYYTLVIQWQPNIYPFIFTSYSYHDISTQTQTILHRCIAFLSIFYIIFLYALCSVYSYFLIPISSNNCCSHSVINACLHLFTQVLGPEVWLSQHFWISCPIKIPKIQSLWSWDCVSSQQPPSPGDYNIHFHVTFGSSNFFSTAFSIETLYNRLRLQSKIPILVYHIKWITFSHSDLVGSNFQLSLSDPGSRNP